MAFDWGNLLTPGRNRKQLITGFKIHCLTGRKDVIQMLHKLNVCSSYNDISYRTNHGLGWSLQEIVLANTC